MRGHGGPAAAWTLAAAAALCGGSVVRAERPLADYSFVRGVNHGLTGDGAKLARELGYARRVGLNSTRIWLSIAAYEADPQGYVERLRTYIRLSHGMGLSTMPILFNGNGLDPAMLSARFRARGERYVQAILGGVKDEPGLLMWDVMNEPFTNDYHDQATGEARAARVAEITRFVRHFLTHARTVDARNALTVGYTLAAQMEPTADLVDVLSFHDYSETSAQIEAAYRTAEDIARRFAKPVMNTETGCIARANPYDRAIAIADAHKTGFYLFNLMIGGNWGQIHGIFYPDGTIRDPATVAALIGFQRNRDLATIVPPRADREGSAARAVRRIEAALSRVTNPFAHVDTSTDELLDAAEHAANLLEAADETPMAVPPTARIMAWRAQPAAARDREAIRRFAYTLGLELKQRSLLF